MGVAMRGTHDADRCLCSIARPRLAGDDDHAAAVEAQADVVAVKRCHVKLGRQSVVDGQRIARPRLGVHPCPLAGGHRNFGQLLGRRAELIHVPGSNQCVGRQRHERPERRLELAGDRVSFGLGRRLAVLAATLARRIGYQRHLAMACGDGQFSVLDEGLEGAAAKVSRVAVASFDADVLADLDRPFLTHGVDEYCIDIADIHPRPAQCFPGSQCDHRQFGVVVNPTERCLGDTRNVNRLAPKKVSETRHSNRPHTIRLRRSRDKQNKT